MCECVGVHVGVCGCACFSVSVWVCMWVCMCGCACGCACVWSGLSIIEHHSTVLLCFLRVPSLVRLS